MRRSGLDYALLVCRQNELDDVNSVWMWSMLPAFRKYMLPPSSGWKCVRWVSVNTRSYFENLGMGRRVGMSPLRQLGYWAGATECTPPPQIQATDVPEWQVTHQSARKE
jgi:hypothetical protein